MYEMNYPENVPPEFLNDFQMPPSEFVHNEIILIARDNSLSVADRTTLAINSSFFQEKLTNPDTDDVAIKLDCVDGAILEAFLDFFSTGSIDIHGNNVQEIFSAAYRLRFTKILERCDDFFAANVDERSVWFCMCIGGQYKLLKTIKATHEFAVRNFRHITWCDEFVRLEANQLVQLLNDDDLCVIDELEAFEAVKRWLLHSYATRLAYVRDLLSSLRLTHLNVTILSTEVLYLATEANCRPMIEKAISLVRLDARHVNEPLRFKVRARNPIISTNCQCVGCGSGGVTASRSVSDYMPNRKRRRHKMSLNAV